MLQDLRVTSTVFCRSEMRAPWGFAVKAHGRMAFHLVLAGGGWLEVEGAVEPLRLEAGDVVVLPHGPTHRLRSDSTAPIEWLDDILQRSPLQRGQLAYGGRGARTDLVCGVFTVENGDAVPVLRALPTVTHIENRKGVAPAWLKPMLDLLRAEIASFEPGSESVVARIADILLLQAVRSALSDGPRWRNIYDPQVGKALRLMRERRQAVWTVEKLASAVAASRTAFADRFHEATGMPPMKYLTRLRMAAAARELRASTRTLAQIAARVGYSSEGALSKAFHREMGMAPRAYRAAGRLQWAGGPPAAANGRASK
jgi:AraC-like DNA-binding protein